MAYKANPIETKPTLFIAIIKQHSHSSIHHNAARVGETLSALED
jgi:hypothetical protein